MNTEGECFDAEDARICLSAGAGAFQLVVTNDGDSDLVFDLTGATYRDEHGNMHGVYAFPDAEGWSAEWKRAARPFPVSSGERAVFFVAPLEKAYYVHESDEEQNLIHEVMLPWDTRGRSKGEIRKDQDRLIASRVPVSLTLPVTIQGVRRSIQIEFVLEDP